MTLTVTVPVKTQVEIIEARLMAGKTILTWQAYLLHEITCLVQRIYDLRIPVLPIQSRLLTRNDKRFSQYWLDTSTIGFASQPTNSIKQLAKEV